MIYSLTGLRAIAALFVFLFHASVVAIDGNRVYLEFLNCMLVRNGDFGVDIFFSLSGYVIALAYGENFRKFKFSQYIKFICSRVSRLWPLHIFTMLLMLGAYYMTSSGPNRTVNTYNYEFRSIFFSVFMMHEWFSENNFLRHIASFIGMLKNIGPIGTPNSVSWSISSEFFVYLLFPIFLLLIKSAKPALSMAAILIFGFGLVVYCLIPSDNLLRVVYCFVGGVWIQQANIHLKFFNATNTNYFGLILGLFLFVILSLFRMGEGGFPYLIAVVTVVLLINAVADEEDVLGKAISSKLLVYLGEISYAFYMIHWFCLKLCTRLVLSNGYTSVKGVAYLATSLLAAFFLAAILHKYLEVPARFRLRSLCFKH